MSLARPANPLRACQPGGDGFAPRDEASTLQEMIHGTRGTGHRWQQRNRVVILRALAKAGATSPPSTRCRKLIKADTGTNIQVGCRRSPARPHRKKCGGRSRPAVADPFSPREDWKLIRFKARWHAAGGRGHAGFLRLLPCEFDKGAIEGVAGPRRAKPRSLPCRRSAFHEPIMGEFLRRAMLLSKGDATVLVTHPDQRVLLLAAALLAGIQIEPVLVVSEREPLVRSLGLCRASIASVCTRSGAQPLEPFRRSRWPGRRLRGTRRSDCSVSCLAPTRLD